MRTVQYECGCTGGGDLIAPHCPMCGYPIGVQYPEAWKRFGERLRSLRLSRPLTLRKFSAEIGYSPVAVSAVEQGNIKEFESVALAMCVALRVPWSECEVALNNPRTTTST